LNGLTPEFVGRRGDARGSQRIRAPDKVFRRGERDYWEEGVVHISMFRGGVASLMLAAFLAVGSRALAETASFRADLKGASEVPPTDRKGIGTVSVSPRLG
jgi:hypothetical protein